MALVVLPILPDRAYGPFAVLNPFKIGLMIALVAGVSFAGYVVARVFGTNRGLLLTGLLGGLASSTAVTLTFSGRAKEDKALAAPCAIAILAACSTMFPRVLVVVSAVDRPLLPRLLWPLSIMALTGFAAAILIYFLSRNSNQTSKEVPLRNPFQLRKAIEFGLIYAVVLFLAKVAQTYFGQKGIFASSILAGLTDVDAIVLSLTSLHQNGLSEHAAATGITLAAITNTIVKAALTLFLGGRALGARVGISLGTALLAGAVTLWLSGG